MRPCPHVPGFNCPMMPGLECPSADHQGRSSAEGEKRAYCEMEARRSGFLANLPDRPYDRKEGFLDGA